MKTLSFALAVASLAAAAPPAWAGDPAAGKPFTITIAAPDAHPGNAATARIEVKAAAGYHINRDFPTSLKLVAPPGVAVPQATLTGRDPGVKLSEEEIRFDVAFTPKEAGTKTFNGMLSFAVCTATSCDPRKAPVTFTVAVK